MMHTTRMFASVLHVSFENVFQQPEDASSIKCNFSNLPKNKIKNEKTKQKRSTYRMTWRNKQKKKPSKMIN